MGDSLSGIPFHVGPGGEVSASQAPQTAAPAPGVGRSVVPVGGGGDVLVLSYQPARIGAVIQNPAGSAGVVLLAIGDQVPTLADYSVELAPGDQYEIPFGYIGAIHAIKAGAAVNLLVTDIQVI